MDIVISNIMRSEIILYARVNMLFKALLLNKENAAMLS